MGNRTFRDRTKCVGLALGAAVLIGLLAGDQAFSATLDPNACVGTAFGKSLVCTANDIRIATVSQVTDLQGNPLNSCIRGIPFSFIAKFDVTSTATSRYDIGLWFNTKGGANAVNGNQCTTQMLTLMNGGIGSTNYVQLDGDLCGDVNTPNNPQQAFLRFDNVDCVDTDGDGTLNLPYCASWSQNSGATCNTPQNTVPGSPSKCNCDDHFNIPDIRVEQISLIVEKNANPTQVDEPGGLVEFTVSVRNPAQVTTATLTTLIDDPDNNPLTNNNLTFNAADVCLKTVLAPGESTTCTFPAMVLGNVGQSITDQACVRGHDSNVPPQNIEGCNTASVSIRDVLPTAALAKTVESFVCAEIKYKVKVDNTNTNEALTLTSLVDDRFGDITTVHGDVVSSTCSVSPNPVSIAAGGSYTCYFNAKICDQERHVNTVTGTLNDDENNVVTPSPSGTTSVTVTVTTP